MLPHFVLHPLETIENNPEAGGFASVGIITIGHTVASIMENGHIKPWIMEGTQLTVWIIGGTVGLISIWSFLKREYTAWKTRKNTKA